MDKLKYHQENVLCSELHKTFTLDDNINSHRF